MKKMSISIPEPCHEDWQKMTPQQKGKYCNVCEKVVTDFSQMNDEELITFLQKAKGQKTCGYFSVSQINKPYLTYTKLEKHYLHIQKSYRDSWLKSFYLLLLSGLLAFSGCQEPKEKKKTPTESVEKTNNPDTLFKEAIYYQYPIDCTIPTTDTTNQETESIINEDVNLVIAGRFNYSER